MRIWRRSTRAESPFPPDPRRRLALLGLPSGRAAAMLCAIASPSHSRPLMMPVTRRAVLAGFAATAAGTLVRCDSRPQRYEFPELTYAPLPPIRLDVAVVDVLEDRKSVASGQGVSVRVDLGGRRYH